MTGEGWYMYGSSSHYFDGDPLDAICNNRIVLGADPKPAAFWGCSNCKDSLARKRGGSAVRSERLRECARTNSLRFEAERRRKAGL